ncbi:MAG: protein kinase, partial [Pseudomonadota bacterium]
SERRGGGVVLRRASAGSGIAQSPRLGARTCAMFSAMRVSYSDSDEVGAGTVLDGTYEVISLLGRGGMGAVWAAKHLRLPKRVAIKVLTGAAAADPATLARFRREADIASRLGHPNIIEVLDFNVLPVGTPYLVMELLEGECLASRLRHGPMAISQAMSIARQIGSALHAAHRENVVHRDLKPGNIFLCPRESDAGIVDHVKVLDFGISKIRGSDTILTQEATILGTPQYMSPEQASGRNSTIDAKTDQFALAAIVYEMLAGRPAFCGSTLAEIVYRIVYEEPIPLVEAAPAVPPPIAAAAARAMAKQPEHRFPDVPSFIGELSGRPLITLERQSAAPPPETLQGIPSVVPSPASSGGSPVVSRGTAPSAPPGTPSGASRSTVVGTPQSAPPAATTDAQPGGMRPGTRPAPSTAPPPALFDGIRPSQSLPGEVAAPGVTAMSDVSASRVSAPGKRRTVLAAVAGLLTLVFSVATAMVFSHYRREGGTTSATTSPAAGAGTATPAPTSTTAASSGSTPMLAGTAAPAPATKNVTAATSATTTAATANAEPRRGGAGADLPATIVGRHQESVPPPPPEVAADLDNAERSLAAGNYQKALHLAQRTLHRQTTDRAFRIILLTKCASRDLRGVNATLKKIPARDRPTLKRRCREMGLDADL